VWKILAFLMIAQAQAETPHAKALALAHADLARLPPEVRYHTRYLSLYATAEKDRPEAIKVLAGHVQHLSRQADITRPGALAGGSLLKLNLLDYGWTPEQWERLNDPYFTVASGKENHPAPWLGDRHRLAEVVAWTGSWVPVVSAEWFFNATATAEGGRLYYEFLGVKTVAEFEKIGGFDRKTSESFRVELRESVALSGVTLQPRAIARWDALGGGYWRTFDFRRATGKANPLQILGANIDAVADASEGYLAMPNGFWATYAADAKGNLVGAVPGDIAGDHGSKSNDKQIHPNISCLRCHGDGGLKAIDGWTRNLLTPPLELKVYDAKEYRRLKQQYLRKLEPFLERDKAQYRIAVKEATGFDSKTYALKYSTYWESYEDAKVDLAFAARYVGCEPEALRGNLLSAVKAGYYVSPVASMFVHTGDKARAIGIRQFEEVFPELMRWAHPPILEGKK